MHSASLVMLGDDCGGRKVGTYSKILVQSGGNSRKWRFQDNDVLHSLARQQLTIEKLCPSLSLS